MITIPMLFFLAFTALSFSESAPVTKEPVNEHSRR